VYKYVQKNVVQHKTIKRIKFVVRKQSGFLNTFSWDYTSLYSPTFFTYLIILSIPGLFSLQTSLGCGRPLMVLHRKGILVWFHGSWSMRVLLCNSLFWVGWLPFDLMVIFWVSLLVLMCGLRFFISVNVFFHFSCWSSWCFRSSTLCDLGENTFWCFVFSRSGFFSFGVCVLVVCDTHMPWNLA
jgi:hypothetical protein